MSIEVLKDDCLQKINFRVKNKNVLREEVKEKMTWNVDRSSPSNKIRDMMKWSKDILKDIYYQRKILSNPFATFFTKQWVLWNQIVILLSVAINILMLVTWNAHTSLEDVEITKNATSVPNELYEPLPRIELEQYDVIILALGGVHNFFCGLVLLFLCMSIMGTIFRGYFFAFHLLNIVNNNQLLRGVIQAVTQNGKSLLWVAVLGFVVFYLYGLVSFALLRSSFDPDNDLYCATLWQCTVTVIRYGLVGQIFDKLNSHPAENTFTKFGLLVIFHLSFFIFITTIGLNIIFGIIVDTFSELRDLKGFDHHINYEHDIWAYIFFFIHLHDTKQCDYTSLELYIYRLLSQEKFDFFPLNRALSLSVMDEGSTDSKIDDLLKYVVTMVDRQREEDAKTKREEERQKQLRWREENRSALLQIGRSQTDPGNEGGQAFGGTLPRRRRKQLEKLQHYSHDYPLYDAKEATSDDHLNHDDAIDRHSDGGYRYGSGGRGGGDDEGGGDSRSISPSGRFRTREPSTWLPEESVDSLDIDYNNESEHSLHHHKHHHHEGMEKGVEMDDRLASSQVGVTTFESRASSIIAPNDYQEDYDGQALLPLSLEKMTSRRSDTAASCRSDLDRMSPIDAVKRKERKFGKSGGPSGSGSGGRKSSVSSRSAGSSINRDIGNVDGDDEAAILDDPFEVRSERGGGRRGGGGGGRGGEVDASHTKRVGNNVEIINLSNLNPRLEQVRRLHTAFKIEKAFESLQTSIM
ncbi:hypothetical protein HELRODRAFT_176700 [Helobdella robusta]|uniref:Ion transport domain-containing protein n=1 Tax=Helobdella robusta TaxID=6412 RepID=T1FAS9_HELRO|nr:hypothetical protein HELRODRAFT_176700 [Helobdella robusta]ESN99534.1 hypothetical protein HELRODRAFT_176700 [Helobdella robusta]